MLDDFEIRDTPWLLTNQCEPFPVDHLASSLIHVAEPFLFPGGGTIGLVFAADTPILCVYPEDAGSGGKANGGCTAGWDYLLSTLKWQRHGKFNEVIVGGMWYERNLPRAIEAIVYTTHSYWEEVLGPGLGKKEEEEKARKVHQDFLRYYKAEGLTAQEVPLLRFDGHVFEDVS